MKHPKPADAGFTLLELVAVMAIFALVATMSVQALQGALRSQRKLAAQSHLNADLSLALTRMRLDMESAVPIAFKDVNGVQHPALEIDRGIGKMALSVGGLVRFPEEPSAGLGRIEWRLNLDSNQIMRRYWPTLMPGREGASSVEIPMMDDVRALEIWTFRPTTGWVLGWVPESASDVTLPLAIRVVIETGVLGRLELLERL